MFKSRKKISILVSSLLVFSTNSNLQSFASTVYDDNAAPPAGITLDETTIKNTAKRLLKVNECYLVTDENLKELIKNEKQDAISSQLAAEAREILNVRPVYVSEDGLLCDKNGKILCIYLGGGKNRNAMVPVADKYGYFNNQKVQ